MTIQIDDFDVVAAAVAEYRSLLKVRSAIAEGDIHLEAIKDANHYDLVAMFGIDMIRQTILPRFDDYLQAKRDALATLDVTAVDQTKK